jgi:hypothetical protein
MLFVALAAVTWTAAAAQTVVNPPQSLPTAPSPGAPPLAAGPDADLDILFTAQVAGWIEPCG